MDQQNKLLIVNENGIYCPAGDFYIDPWKRVDRAVITHAHSDHARPGSLSYLSCSQSELILKERLGRRIQIQTMPFNRKVSLNGVSVSFHPAGHVPGSAQVRVEFKGEVWVVSGDYKIENDNLSTAFEPVKCHTFITESTFGAPLFHWESQELVFDRINNWWRKNQIDGRTSLIYAYSLGKAQRIVNWLDHSIGRIYTHPVITSMNKQCLEAGFLVKDTIPLALTGSQDYRGAMIITPQSRETEKMKQHFTEPEGAYVSGWMQIKKMRKSAGTNRGFVLSDHADWGGLLYAIKETDAQRIYVVHGYTQLLCRYLNQIGIAAEILSDLYTNR